MIDTGDTVFHKPTGETWIVACVRDGRLSWAGWPEGWADLSDCELKKTASDDERFDLLTKLAESRNANDHRVRYARWRLNEIRETVGGE